MKKRGKSLDLDEVSPISAKLAANSKLDGNHVYVDAVKEKVDACLLEKDKALDREVFNDGKKDEE